MVAGKPSWPGMLVTFPVLKNLCVDAFTKYTSENCLPHRANSQHPREPEHKPRSNVEPLTPAHAQILQHLCLS